MTLGCQDMIAMFNILQVCEWQMLFQPHSIPHPSPTQAPKIFILHDNDEQTEKSGCGVATCLVHLGSLI